MPSRGGTRKNPPGTCISHERRVHTRACAFMTASSWSEQILHVSEFLRTSAYIAVEHAPDLILSVRSEIFLPSTRRRGAKNIGPDRNLASASTR